MTKKLETVKEEDLIRRKDGLYYKKYARVPFTGISEEFFEKGLHFYDNDQLHFKLNYKNGKEEGLYEVFDEYGE